MQYLAARDENIANLANISVVLCRPKFAGNVGFVARCIKNMGIGKLMVVRDIPFENEEIQGTATPFARDVVENIVYHSTLADALAPMNFVVGATARKGEARGPQVIPRIAAAEIVARYRDNNIALLSGSEDKGLANQNLLFCHQIVNIPTSSDFSSINLSHAVMILCYEVFQASSLPPTKFVQKTASVQETEQMFSQMQTFLQEIGFLKKEDPEHWFRHIRQFCGRTKILSKDVKIVRGVIRKIEWNIEKQQHR